MNYGYEKFIDGIGKYYELYEKGLKKQANKYIKAFAADFKKSVMQSESDDIMFHFCRELIDEDKHKKFKERGNGSLPFEINRLVWEYLKHQCELEKMPHLRWTFQLYGRYHNPFNQKWEINMYDILLKAYRHKDCDQKTVDLYFGEQLDFLAYGAHHFPEACIITKKAYEKAVENSESVVKEKFVRPELAEKLEYFKKLYQCFFAFEESNREKDFYKLCGDCGIDSDEAWTYFYNS